MYEQASERWSPVQSVEKVLLSVISMLAGMYMFFLPLSLLFRCPFLLIILLILNTPACKNRTSRVALTLIAASYTGITTRFVALIVALLVSAAAGLIDLFKEYERMVRESIKEQLGL